MPDIRINGRVYDWGSVLLYIDGQRYGEDSGILSIAFSEKRDRTKVGGIGRSRRPRAKSGGKYEAETIKVEMLENTKQALFKDLAEASDSGTSFGDREFPMSLQLAEPNLDTVSYDWEGCTVDGQEASGNESETGALKSTVSIGPLSMKTAGRTLYAAPAQ